MSGALLYRTFRTGCNCAFLGIPTRRGVFHSVAVATRRAEHVKTTRFGRLRKVDCPFSISFDGALFQDSRIWRRRRSPNLYRDSLIKLSLVSLVSASNAMWRHHHYQPLHQHKTRASPETPERSELGVFRLVAPLSPQNG